MSKMGFIFFEGGSGSDEVGCGVAKASAELCAVAKQVPIAALIFFPVTFTPLRGRKGLVEEPEGCTVFGGGFEDVFIPPDISCLACVCKDCNRLDPMLLLTSRVAGCTELRSLGMDGLLVSDFS